MTGMERENVLVWVTMCQWVNVTLMCTEVPSVIVKLIELILKCFLLWLVFLG